MSAKVIELRGRVPKRKLALESAIPITCHSVRVWRGANDVLVEIGDYQLTLTPDESRRFAEMLSNMAAVVEALGGSK